MGVLIKAELKFPVTLMISYLGFADNEVIVDSISQQLIIPMQAQEVRVSNDVVISASRLSERIQTSLSSIQKLNAKQIQSTASGNFYQGLGNLKSRYNYIKYGLSSI